MQWTAEMESSRFQTAMEHGDRRGACIHLLLAERFYDSWVVGVALRTKSWRALMPLYARFEFITGGAC